jgi:hypothetical protein
LYALNVEHCADLKPDGLETDVQPRNNGGIRATPFQKTPATLRRVATRRGAEAARSRVIVFVVRREFIDVNAALLDADGVRG